MGISLGKLTYTDLPLIPKVSDTDTSRFFNKIGEIFNRMSGNGDAEDRVITLGDLNNSLLSPARWVDYNVGGVSLGQGASAPDLVAYASSNIMMPCFDGGVTTEQLYGCIELNHDYKEGTDIYFHVHWMPTTATAGKVVWQLEYAIIRNGFALTPATTVRRLDNSPAVQWQMVKSELPAITGTNLKIGDQFMFRLFRDPTYNSGGLTDTYPNDAMVATVGLHVQVDGFGSRKKFTKF